MEFGDGVVAGVSGANGSLGVISGVGHTGYTLGMLPL